MIEKTGPGKGPHQVPASKTTPAKKFTKDFKDEGAGATHRFGSMVFTDKQWSKFLNNLANSIMQEIKRQEKRMKKAAEKLKKSIEGRD